jgi:hypothetical protein
MTETAEHPRLLRVDLPLPSLVDGQSGTATIPVPVPMPMPVTVSGGFTGPTHSALVDGPGSRARFEWPCAVLIDGPEADEDADALPYAAAFDSASDAKADAGAMDLTVGPSDVALVYDMSGHAIRLVSSAQATHRLF